METGRPGDYHRNQEPPSKIGRVDRYVLIFFHRVLCDHQGVSDFITP